MLLIINRYQLISFQLVYENISGIRCLITQCLHSLSSHPHNLRQKLTPNHHFPKLLTTPQNF